MCIKSRGVDALSILKICIILRTRCCNVLFYLYNFSVFGFDLT
jgi:hypothetical protein